MTMEDNRKIEKAKKEDKKLQKTPAYIVYVPLVSLLVYPPFPSSLAMLDVG